MDENRASSWEDDPHPNAKKGMPLGLKVAIGCLVLFGLGGLGCVGLGLMCTQAAEVVIESQVEPQLRKNAVIREHIGVLEEVDWKMIETGSTGDDDSMVFRVKGSKASGSVLVEVEPAGNQFELLAGTLTLDSGEEHDLFPDGERPELRDRVEASPQLE